MLLNVAVTQAAEEIDDLDMRVSELEINGKYQGRAFVPSH